MSYQKALLLTFFSLAFYATNANAMIQQKYVDSNEIQPWKLTRSGYVLIQANKHVVIDWYVNSHFEDSAGNLFPADTVTLICDGEIYNVVANTHHICELKQTQMM